MKRLKVILKDNETGKTHEYIEDEIPDNNTPADIAYQWGVGNFSCDCNRATFCDLAVWVDEYPCGNERFDIVSIELAGEDITQIVKDEEEIRRK